MNIVFSDVDGTFQDLGVPVPQINIDAVKRLQEAGDHFVFVTGRGIGLVEQMEQEIGIDCDVIFGNGAGFKARGKFPTYSNCLSIDTLRLLLPILDEENILYFIHTDTEVVIQPVEKYEVHLQKLRESLSFMGNQGRLLMDYKTEYFKEQCYHVENVIGFFEAHPERTIVKIELMEASDKKHEILRERLTIKDTYVFTSFIKTLEIVNPLSTKGAAIRSYLEKLPHDLSFGIGDGENDLTMFETVDVAVAVANASDTVKNKSHKTTLSCNEGGVGKFIFDEILNYTE